LGFIHIIRVFPKLIHITNEIGKTKGSTIDYRPHHLGETNNVHMKLIGNPRKIGCFVQA
jgi:hypothetical protein